MAALIKTETSGWFLNPETGKKARKKDGDTVYDTKAEWERAGMKPGNQGAPKSKDVDKPEVEYVTIDTGKRVPKTQTTVIKCSHIDDGNPKNKPYDTVKVGKGKKERTISGLTSSEKEQACGKERRIKKQDMFQVRHCEAHQKEHRKAIRREKIRARRAAAKGTAAAQK